MRDGQMDKSTHRKGQKSMKTCTKTTTSKPKPSHPSLSDLKCMDEEGERENAKGAGLDSLLTKRQSPVECDFEAPFDDISEHTGPEPVCPLPSNNDHPIADMDDDCVIVTEDNESPKIQSPSKDIVKLENTVSDPLNLHHISRLMRTIGDSEPCLDEDIELQTMFYLPKWDSAASSDGISPPGKHRVESLKVILANVAELLSRSPPSVPFDLEGSLYESLPPSPGRLEEDKGPFQVNFALDLHDDDDLMSEDYNASPRADSDEVPIDVTDNHDSAHQQPPQLFSNRSPAAAEPAVNRGHVAASSPSWDEVFGDEVVYDNHHIKDDGINKELDNEIDDDLVEELVDGDAKKCKGMESEGSNEEKDHLDDARNEEMADFLADDGMDEEGNSHLPHLHHPPLPQPPAEQGCRPNLDDSMDLFEDDEAFLQMTIPDIPTPEDSCITSNTSYSTEHNANNVKNTSSAHAPMSTLSSTHLSDSKHRLNTTHTHETADLHTKCTLEAINTTRCLEREHENTIETNKDALETRVTKGSMGDKVDTLHHTSPIMKQRYESFDSSRDFFSVNFDLGYSLEDSEDEVEEEAAPAPSTTTSPTATKQEVAAASTASLPAISGSSTPCHSFHRQRLQSSETKLSTPLTQSERRRREAASLLTSPLTSKGGALPSPITSLGVRRTLMPGHSGICRPSSLSSLKRRWPEGPNNEAERGVSPRPKVLDVEDGSHQEYVSGLDPPAPPGECDSDSEDEVVVQKRRHQTKANPLSSPEVSKVFSDVDSPLLLNRKNTAALNISDETEREAVSDDDFQNDSVFVHRATVHEPARQHVRQRKPKPALRRGGRHFLDEEAELSEEDAEVSSDEEDGEDQNQSLEGFVVDNSHFSQGLNDSDMHGVYLKSVRSPAVAGKFKMVYRKQHDMDIFSQVPEMDETYAEDSFVVGSEVEEMESSEEESEDDVMELIPEDSYVDGKKQYTTRRRALLRKNRAQVGSAREQRAPQPKAGVKTKCSRIIRINDSSEEETEQVVKDSRVMPNGDVAAPLRPKAVQQDLATSKPTLQQKAPSSCPTIAAKVSLLSRAQRGSVDEDQKNERCHQRLQNQALLSDELDFQESESLLDSRKAPQASTSTSDSTHQPQKPIGPALSTGESPAPSGLVSVLVDSRCISGGAELVTSLRQHHAATVYICSLDGNYFIVSSRMAVERHSQSDLAAMQNRKRLAERVNSLQGLFERVCLVVEKDRTKPGEASRPFQRSRYYDSTVAALVRTGVRLLWSNGPEESAALLADLARLEQRKGQGITVPLEVKGQHRQQALQFYLSLPSVNYVHALNMIHNFRSIAHLINSSIEAIQKGGCMSRSRAEEIYRCLRYSCDSFLINTVTSTKNS